MTTQDEIDEMFVNLLENIYQICNKTTFANVSHYIATVKCKCRDMLQFYRENPVSPWHSVADGDLPKGLKNDDGYMPFIVKTKGGKQHLAYYASWLDEEYRAIRHDFFDECDCLLDVEYWMEIPKLPTK